MIDLQHGTLIHHGQETIIDKWEVWFLTPFGMFQKLEVSVQRCADSDLDPEITITAISIAIGKDGYYEPFFPRR